MSQKQTTSTTVNNSDHLSRRGFIAGAGAVALSFTIADTAAVRTYAANNKVNLGVIGSGSRGTWIAGLFNEHGGYNIAATADYFKDRADDCGGEFNVPESRRYTGLYGYRKMFEHVDAVVIESPPYFHPQQVADAVDAGKHTYVAKPIAVDVPGCHSIGASGKKATAKKLCFLVDFQTRSDPFFMEALKRVKAGALGDLVFGEGIYHANCPFGRMYDTWRKDPTDSENRLRAWGLDNILSGDIITEQNIHPIDVMSWVMGTEPLWAAGTGGRTIRPVGTCWDHFALVFQYPGNIGITFSSKQFKGHGTKPSGIRNRMFGTKGVLETHYGGQVLIRGEGDTFYRGGNTSAIYKDGAIANIATFHKSIAEGNYENPTVPESVKSNLITILGRTAAYEQTKVTWKEILNKNEKLDANLKGLKA